MSYTFSLSRRSLPVRCLCLLLIVLVLWCFFMVPRANAVLLEGAAAYYAAEVVIGVLATAGVVFASSDDAKSIASSIVGKLKDKTMSTLTAMFAAHSKLISTDIDMAKSAFRVSQDVLQDIIDSFKVDYSDGVYSSAGSKAFETFISGRGKSDFYIKTWYFEDKYSGFQPDKGQCVFHMRFGDDISDTHVSVGYDTYTLSGRKIQPNAIGLNLSTKDRVLNYAWLFDSETHSVQFVTTYFSNYLQRNVVDKTNVITLPDDYLTSTVVSADPFNSIGVTVPDGDLVYPSDDYLVRTPDLPQVDAETGAATWPSDVAYTKDAVSVPYPVDGAGEKVGTIPYDVPVDQTTGKDLTDTDNPSKPGEGTETGSNTSLLQKILDLLKNFFDSPSDFRLNMDGFRNLAIKDKFPFCIPFDMVDSVKQFAADAADYQFRVKLDTQYFKVDHVVDLTPLAVPLAFFRYLVVAWFAWVLMSRTHDLMKW